MNILIVDDIPEYSEIIKMFLEDYFNKFLIAYNFDSAKKIIKEKGIDFAIIDIRLKEDDENNTEGIELIKLIKEKNKKCKIIAMSAYREFEYAFEALNAGADVFIRKPIEPQKLIESIKKLIKEQYGTFNSTSN